VAGFVLSSLTFTEGGAIPTKHTCDGENLSPALTWEGAPSGAQAFALIVEDPDAHGFVHWVAFDVPGIAAGALPEGVGPADLPQGRTGFGRSGYGGPCPPSGTHHYVFTFYALSRPLALGGSPIAAELRLAMAGLVLGETRLTGTYTRKR
jgi:Raf kinase inhibitor-like YbhB/YbcL family protein